MAVTIQLKDFTAKPAPVPADIIYGANSADSFNEVQMTIEDLIAAYPGLSSLGSLTTIANEMIYTTGVDTYAMTAITAFGRSVVALAAAPTAPVAGSLTGWDVNKNLSANNYIAGFLSVPSAAATTVLTVASAEYLEITGTTTQTVTLPVPSTMVAGTPFSIINNSSGVVTVNSSGGNLVQTMAAGTQLDLILLINSGTTAASWQSSYIQDNGLAGAVLLSPSGAQTIATYPLNVPGGVYTPSILDSNGLILVAFTTVATAVNHLTVSNSATGTGVQVSATGTDTNINLTLNSQGTGSVVARSRALTNQFFMVTGTALDRVSYFNMGSVAGSYIYTYPDATGTLLMTGVAINSVPSIAFSSTSGVIGTITNDDAAAGSVGQFVTSNIPEASSVSLVSGAGTNITSISLGAGDWDIFGNISFGGDINTVVGFALGSASTTSTSLGDSSNYGCIGYGSPGLAAFANSTRIGITIPPLRLSLAGTTTVYLVGDMLFTVGAGTACGTLSARRRR